MFQTRTLTTVLTTVLTALAVTATVFAAPGTTTQPSVGAAIDTASYCADSEEQAFLTLLNAYRVQNGLVPLALGQSAGAAADHHSVDMATNNYFSHTLADGTDWYTNMLNHGYPSNSGAGENIAAGQSTALAVFEAWRNSPGHNTNMLSPSWVVVGVGFASNAGAGFPYYWTTDFGSVADAAAVLCGSGAPAPVATSTLVPQAPASTSTLVPQVPAPTSTLVPEISVPTSADHKVTVCHFSEEAGTYRLISVALNGYAHGHAKHVEDFLFDAALFDEDCVAV